MKSKKRKWKQEKRWRKDEQKRKRRRLWRKSKRSENWKRLPQKAREGSRRPECVGKRERKQREVGKDYNPEDGDDGEDGGEGVGGEEVPTRRRRRRRANRQRRREKRNQKSQQRVVLHPRHRVAQAWIQIRALPRILTTTSIPKLPTPKSRKQRKRRPR